MILATLLATILTDRQNQVYWPTFFSPVEWKRSACDGRPFTAGVEDCMPALLQPVSETAAKADAMNTNAWQRESCFMIEGSF
ncbi:MAG: hypothetical protein WAK16_13670 [Candidatus Cybelea sp.]